MMKIATKISPVSGFEYRLIINEERQVIAINYYFKGNLLKKVPLKKRLMPADFHLDEIIYSFLKDTVDRL
ncbi:hypothetical protein [Mangrovibacterium diazotrophicum]|uniref:Uncharacterized protein n=1 Tax=Mangrovibacterium diazotrophicum TaxID=1261403 RepID=A0A419W3G9_9BACT|nr:hypothetical protein [Mangrovibacterium diazotrophicum]RKD90022.1 hypothetical protein BC643_0358 [Mangrovibacterium diazotrophicum]